MKRRFLFSLRVFQILLIWTTLASAQGLGVRFGLNYSSASTEPELPLRSWTGAMVGGTGEVKLDQYFFLLGGVIYAEKGAKITLADSVLGNFETIAKFNYLEFPIALKAKLGTASLKPYLFAGPNYGINLSAENRNYFNDGSVIIEDIKGETRKIYFNLDFGCGVEYAVVPNLSFLFDTRYSLGLSNMIISNENSWKSHSLQLIGGVLLK